MAQTHSLKTWTEFYRPAAEGLKTFEVRKNDRDYQMGDILRLHEYDPVGDCYSGNVAVFRVTYVLMGGQFGIDPGYCVMGLKRLPYYSERAGMPSRRKE